MHAVVLSEFGGPTALRAGTFPDPSPRPGWVSVELRAAALNWHDVLVRQGRYGSPLPHVIGAERRRCPPRHRRGRGDRAVAALGPTR